MQNSDGQLKLDWRTQTLTRLIKKHECAILQDKEKSRRREDDSKDRRHRDKDGERHRDRDDEKRRRHRDKEEGDDDDRRRRHRDKNGDDAEKSSRRHRGDRVSHFKFLIEVRLSCAVNYPTKSHTQSLKITKLSVA